MSCGEWDVQKTLSKYFEEKQIHTDEQEFTVLQVVCEYLSVKNPDNFFVSRIKLDHGKATIVLFQWIATFASYGYQRN